MYYLRQTVVPLVALSVLVVLSGCVSIERGYRTIGVEDEFLARSSANRVKAPVRRYADRFFNIGIGEFAVENVRFGDVVRGKRTFHGRKKVDTTGWNLVLQQQLIFENIYYKQYKVSEQREFSFLMKSPGETPLTVSCLHSTAILENEVEGSVSLLIDGVKRRNPGAESIELAEWLENDLRCTLNQSAQTWTLKVTQHTDFPATYELRSGSQTYSGHRLFDSMAETAATGGDPSKAVVVEETGTLVGLAINKSGRQVGAVSLVEGNNAIWTEEPMPSAEKLLLSGAGYSLILASWRGFSDDLPF